MYRITIANFLPVEKKCQNSFGCITLWVYVPFSLKEVFPKKGTYYIQQIMVMLNAIQELQFINFLV